MEKKTPKRAAALICAALLVAMYIVTFIVACLDIADFARLFTACLLATIGLPILLWLFLWFYGLMKDRQTDVSENLPEKAESSVSSTDLCQSAPPVGKNKQPCRSHNIDRDNN